MWDIIERVMPRARTARTTILVGSLWSLALLALFAGGEPSKRGERANNTISVIFESLGVFGKGAATAALVWALGAIGTALADMLRNLIIKAATSIRAPKGGQTAKTAEAEIAQLARLLWSDNDGPSVEEISLAFDLGKRNDALYGAAEHPVWHDDTSPSIRASYPLGLAAHLLAAPLADLEAMVSSRESVRLFATDRWDAANEEEEEFRSRTAGLVPTMLLAAASLGTWGSIDGCWLVLAAIAILVVGITLLVRWTLALDEAVSRERRLSTEELRQSTNIPPIQTIARAANANRQKYETWMNRWSKDTEAQA